MNVSFKVKPTLSTKYPGFDVVILINGKMASVTTFASGDDIEAKIPELVAKAQSSELQALALENRLNSALGVKQS